MDTLKFEVRRDFQEGQAVLQSLSEDDQNKVELVIQSLAQDPWAKKYAPKLIDDRTVKVTVPVEDNEITILAEVDIYHSTVDVIEIKSRGKFKKALDWLAGLARFEPGQGS